MTLQWQYKKVFGTLLLYLNERLYAIYLNSTKWDYNLNKPHIHQWNVYHRDYMHSQHHSMLEVYWSLAVTKGEQRVICLCHYKTNFFQIIRESSVPCPWGLTKNIQRLIETAHMMRKIGINKPLWLTHVDLFSNKLMEKCILHIQLLDRQTKVNG